MGKKQIIKWLFFFSAGPVLGEILWNIIYILPFGEFMIGISYIPIFGWWLFYISALKFTAAFVPISLLLFTILFLFPYVLFTVTGYLYFKNSKNLSWKYLVCLVVLVVSISSSWIAGIVQIEQSKRYEEKEKSEISELSDHFAQVFSVEYLGVRPQGDLIYFSNGEKGTFGIFRLTVNLEKLTGKTKGRYKVCVQKDTVSDCFLETYITFENGSAVFDPQNYSSPSVFRAEIVTVEGGRATEIVIPGIETTGTSVTTAKLKILSETPQYYHGEVIYSSDLISSLLLTD